MERRFAYMAEEGDAGLTVGEFLKRKGYSRHVLSHLKRTENGILRNQESVFTSERLRCGDRLDIYFVEEVTEQIEPVRLDFGIVYEDEDILVVDKSADMPVHPSMNNHGNTLANALAWYGQEKGNPFVFRCINRLDRNTTGLLIVAKHMLSASGLSVQMKNRQIHRTYLAIVRGDIRSAGTVDMPIGRCEDSVICRRVDTEHGERAVTHYRPVCRGGGWTLVQCELETGRTHQIRVHMSWLGHPLPGDFLYCPEDRSAERQPLHSWKLSFIHPISGEALAFTSPLPGDMKKYMAEHTGG